MIYTVKTASGQPLLYWEERVKYNLDHIGKWIQSFHQLDHMSLCTSPKDKCRGASDTQGKALILVDNETERWSSR